MAYPDRIHNLLKEAKVDIGDFIEVNSKKGLFCGILMPHHEFSGHDILTIKLDTGYNIGIAINDNTRIKLVNKGEKPNKKEEKMEYESGKPKISILGTGGTIASYVDYRTGAVHPAMNARDLAYSVPEIAKMCDIRAKVLFSIFSEDMEVEHWQKLARETASELNSGAKGVIIPHGTDTMGYTACALSFMLRNLSGPVILVGSQRSSDRPSTDANLNLISAAKLAVDSDLGEVVVVMHGETSDSRVLIHRGSRVRKMHTSSRKAFRSINNEPLGTIKDGKIRLVAPHKKRQEGTVEVYDKMEKKVALIYIYPGIDREIFDYIIDNYMGIVIAGTGLGHAPQKLVKSIKYAVSSGIHVVMTSQCLYGGINMNVYSTGRDLVSAGVISGGDMLPETAFVKLMWVLGQIQDPEEVKNIITDNLVGEIGPRREIRTLF